MLKGAFVENLNSNSYLDLELLDDYLARLGKSIVEQMFTLYCQQAEIYLNEIKQAQLGESVTDWQESCHKMKGAAASVGMTQLHGKLKLIETTDAGKAEKAILLSQLQLLNEQEVLAFRNWLEST